MKRIPNPFEWLVKGLILILPWSLGKWINYYGTYLVLNPKEGRLVRRMLRGWIQDENST